MFIYAGLVAAILLAGPPAQSEPEPTLDAAALPGIANAPLLRRDI